MFYILTHLKLNILYLYIGLVVFVIYPSHEHPPEDGHKMWPKRVRGLQR